MRNPIVEEQRIDTALPCRRERVSCTGVRFALRIMRTPTGSACLSIVVAQTIMDFGRGNRRVSDGYADLV